MEFISLKCADKLKIGKVMFGKINYIKAITIYLFLLLLGFGNVLYGQSGPVGKIIPKSEADAQFGSVLNSVTVPAAEVVDWLAQSNNYIMFRIINNSLQVLGDNRTPISTGGAQILPSDIFHLYNKSKVAELLSLGNGTTFSFEVRQNVFSITKDENTLEFGYPCPPFCF